MTALPNKIFAPVTGSFDGPALIVPMLRNAAQIAEIKSWNPPAGLIADPVAGELSVVYARRDEAGNTQTLGLGDLEGLRLTLGKLRDKAEEGLCELMRIGFEHGSDDSLHWLMLGDDPDFNLNSSLLVSRFWWTRMDKDPSLVPVVAVPTTCDLLFTDAEHPGLVRELREAAAGDFAAAKDEGTEPLTTQLFIRQNGKWAVYEEGKSILRKSKPTDRKSVV